MDELRESGLPANVFTSPARERDSERWNRTLRDFMQPMIDWISAARERGGRDNK